MFLDHLRLRRAIKVEFVFQNTDLLRDDADVRWRNRLSNVDVAWNWRLQLQGLFGRR